MAIQSTIYDIVKINDLFRVKNWPMDNTTKNSLYNRFKRQYDQLLSDKERDLFLKLSYRYELINFNQYPDLLIKLMEQCVNHHFSPSTQQILVYPIKKGKDGEKIKSADFLSYLCNSIFFKYSDVLCKIEFLVLGSLNQVQTRKNKFKKQKLLIIDDFIGSGQYASEVLEELVNYGIPKENIIVCTLFISETGLTRILKTGVHLEYLQKVSCVLDSLSDEEKELLVNIENRLNVEDDFRLGYAGSANLITLIRTPNNSLPLFWLDKGRSHKAPFPR